MHYPQPPVPGGSEGAPDLLRDLVASSVFARLARNTARDAYPIRRFVPFNRERTVAAEGRILLTPDGELLSDADRGRGLLLIDSSWRRVAQLLGTVEGEVVPRRLPELITAYPRKSKAHSDPAMGLASVEALYAAALILGEPADELLDDYCWRDRFLNENAQLLNELDSREPVRT